MTLAGLWTSWKQPDDSLFYTCTIITTDANKKLAPIHHRMPVILERDSVEVWLSQTNLVPYELLTAAKDDLVTSEATSRLDRTINSVSAQLSDDQTGRLF